MPRTVFLIICTILCNLGLANGQVIPSQLGECTTAIFSGAVTIDGRPIIWKNRDVSNPDQRYIYYDSYQRDGINTYRFIGDCYRADTTKIYQGTNERGFAIMNSDSYNLRDSLYSGLDDGTIMRLALETCVTLSDFEGLLDSTNAVGRMDCWNFGCLDSTGSCAFYESANRSYRKYDPLDQALNAPGFIVRSNFSFSGDSLYQSGLDRYGRAVELIAGRLDSGQLDVNWVLAVLARDMASIFANPYPLPYHGSHLNGPPGYIYNFACTIANRFTTSVVAIRGVQPGEDPALTTTFAILGQPALSLAYPLWVKTGMVPTYLDDPTGAPMYTYCRDRSSLLYDNTAAYYFLNSLYLVNDDGSGVYSYTLPLEAWGIGEVSRLFESWLVESPTVDDMRLEQSRIATTLFTGFKDETARYLGDSSGIILPNTSTLFNYPNPFNSGTYIVYYGTQSNYPVRVRIFDINGRLVSELEGTGGAVGDVYWTGRDTFGRAVSSGVYFYILDNGPFKSTNKMLLLK
ncbi:MAG TPA: hypothetical protein DCZ43_01640 [candidate division Zixibacteria bacterium]|nr:hypothetical protein [candidate division Zixibacteria bacterium]